MNDAKKTVKTALSLALVVVLIAAALFGLDVPYELDEVVQDTEALEQTEIVAGENTNEESPTPVLPETGETEAPTDEVAPPVEDTEATTDEVETQTPQETAPTDEVVTAAPSETGEVATPSEPTTEATEGDVKNA